MQMRILGQIKGHRRTWTWFLVSELAAWISPRSSQLINLQRWFFYAPLNCCFRLPHSRGTTSECGLKLQRQSELRVPRAIADSAARQFSCVESKAGL
jgi:hypothetical protein